MAYSLFLDSVVEKVVGLTGFVIIHVIIASFSPAQGERNQMVMVNTKFTRLVNEMPLSRLGSNVDIAVDALSAHDEGHCVVHVLRRCRP